MIGKMPKALSDALVAIRSWAIAHGGLVPGADDLARMLGVTPENAKRRIYRIEHDPNYVYFKRKPRMRLLDETKFVTEELTAQIFLLLAKECQARTEGLVKNEEFAEYATKRLSEWRGEEITKETVLQLIKHAARRTDYIATVLKREDSIRPGSRFQYEEEYLKSIAGEIGQKM